MDANEIIEELKKNPLIRELMETAVENGNSDAIKEATEMLKEAENNVR